MSEELIKRLRGIALSKENTDFSYGRKAPLYGKETEIEWEAAGRIEEIEQKLRTTYLEALAISDTNNELQARLSEAVKVLEEVTKAFSEFTSQAPTMLSCGRHCTAEVEHMEEEAYASAHNHAAFQLRQAKAFLATLGEET